VLGRGPGVAQDPGGPLVLQLPLARRQVAVHGLGDQRVDERQGVVAAQHLGPGEGGDHGGGLVLGQPGQRGDLRQGGAVAQDGDRSGDAGRRRGHPAQPHQHQAGDRAGADRGHDVGVRRVRRYPLGLQRPQQLAQQQGVAGGGAMAGGDEGRVGVGLQPVPDERGDAAGRQRFRPHQDGRRVVGQLGQEHLVLGRLACTAGGHHDHRQLLDAPDEVGQEPQRAAVAPLQVVDGDQQRRAGREVHREPVQAVQGRVAGVRKRRFRALRQVEDRSGRGGRSGEDGRGRGRVGDHGFEELAYGAQAVLLLQLAAPSGQGAQVEPGGQATGLGQQAALADARRPLDEDEASAAGAGLTEGVP
jgi:hypothetical protein